MPRTPPPGQGKKWSQRKITTSEIYCAKTYCSVLIFGKLLSMNVSMNESLQVMEAEKKVINDNF